uniref:Lipoprotein n=1 Tax=Roseihalotalea indica TaxID=2867963 RepID=A0AA49JIF4_9BACT|nr:hypothetical protein K4G66_20620 [Tunicatimonas sp. TK19036]
MRTLLKKTVLMAIAFSFPVMFLASCESDMVEPENAMPPKDQMQMPPGLKKK